MLLVAETSRAAFDCESAAIATIADTRSARWSSSATLRQRRRRVSSPLAQRGVSAGRVQDNRGAIVTRGDHMATTTTEIAWGHDFERALTDAKAQRKLVLIDFTAAPM